MVTWMTGRDNGELERGDDPTLARDTNWRQVAQRHFEAGRDGGLTAAIVFAIADAAGVAPSEVKSPPLYETVDVAAIEDAYFGPSLGDGSRQGTGTTEFRYTAYLVKVRSDGWIQVYAEPGPELP